MRWDMLATLTLGIAMNDCSNLPIPTVTLSLEESIIAANQVASIHPTGTETKTEGKVTVFEKNTTI